MVAFLGSIRTYIVYIFKEGITQIKETKFTYVIKEKKNWE
jgi:hypothetical protein